MPGEWSWYNDSSNLEPDGIGLLSMDWTIVGGGGVTYPNPLRVFVGPKAYHSSFDDDQLMKLWLLMVLCLISDRFIIKILVGA